MRRTFQRRFRLRRVIEFVVNDDRIHGRLKNIFFSYCRRTHTFHLRFYQRLIAGVFINAKIIRMPHGRYGVLPGNFKDG